jgi:tetratricopeptide (TPR) repeat protein
VTNNQARLADDQTISALVEAIQQGADDELARTDRLLVEYPDDPRLHFLRGSLLAGLGRSIEALPAYRKAVELAPDFAIARFQLGFFLLTSAEPAEALSVWGPLAMLPREHYLRMFVAGLTHLIRDEFEETIRQLEFGIAANQENPPLNRDMQLIIDDVRKILAGNGAAASASDDSISATSFLLNQFGAKPTKH